MQTAEVFFYKLKIKYKGTDYLGWQIQEAQGKTIQGELNNALRALSKSEQITSIGSGRTDAGVHALAQVARVSIPLFIPAPSLLKAINSHLPQDIRVLECEESSSDFHPTFQAESKIYQYHFALGRDHDPMLSEMITYCPFELDLLKLATACKLFEGEHDFHNFCTEGTPVSTTVRKIFTCHLETKSAVFSPGDEVIIYVLTFHGTGFLKQMVRLLVGALWNVARGKVTEEEVCRALIDSKKVRLGAVAPPQGLYLAKVFYP